MQVLEPPSGGLGRDTGRSYAIRWAAWGLFRVGLVS